MHFFLQPTIQTSLLSRYNQLMNSYPFEVILKNKELILVQNKEIKFSKRKRARFYSYTKAGLSIARKTFSSEKPIIGKEDEIIEKIHQIRFSPNNPYVITGGHFHQLYVRNLGIFYNALLDPRIPSSSLDWINRQKIVLKTIALDLEVFSLAKSQYTTIIPLAGNRYTCLNMYARPSDSLYAILYSLVALTTEGYIASLFPMQDYKTKRLQTKSAGFLLIEKYTQLLQFLLGEYLTEIIDEKIGIIKKNILLSSARDGIKRESSFYDNVIAWATVVLAKRLGIFKISDAEIAGWKQNILQRFWNAKDKLFIDDLSNESVEQRKFSADSFIVISSGFLNPSIRQDRQYLQGMVEYVKNNKLDIPFPLHYSKNDSPQKLYRPVRYFAKSYMGKSIWSHWGMEYIKALILLSKSNPPYFREAKNHLESYRKNIEKYGGYPELYKPDGNIFSSRFYKSVLHNGWVVNYEQAKSMLDSITIAKKN